jgi:antitoxin (DNA-binding transcriptional repressor) of toxin-antitoxin stability system
MKHRSKSDVAGERNFSARTARSRQTLVLRCSVMRRASVRELHIRTSELVREASDGGTILIERRGEAVAELRPIRSPARMSAGKKAWIFSSMRKIWSRMPQAGDSTKILEEDRSG